MMLLRLLCRSAIFYVVYGWPIKGIPKIRKGALKFVGPFQQVPTPIMDGFYIDV